MTVRVRQVKTLKGKKGAGALVEYFTKEQARAEYYTGQPVPSYWAGGLAAAEGYSDPVTGEDLTRMFEGRFHQNGQEIQLGKVGADGELQHRPGYEISISAPKSVSMLALGFGDERGEEIHQAGMRAVLEAIQDSARTRVRGEYVKPDGLALAVIPHALSRAGDFQRHDHVLAANACAVGGKLYSIESRFWMERQVGFDLIYAAGAGGAAERLGFAVNWDERGKFELAAFSREQIEAFSKRKEEVDTWLEREAGLDREHSSAETRALAVKRTRAEKVGPETREAHAERWAAELAELGVEKPEPQKEVADRAAADTPEARQASAREAVTGAIAHLTEREAASRDAVLEREAMRFAGGRCDWADIRAEINRARDSGEIIGARDGRWTTRAMHDLELRNLKHIQAGRGQHLAVMSGAEFDSFLAAWQSRTGRVLGVEQRAAAHMILCGGDRFQLIQGLAGTGKTTALQFIREAAEASGWTVEGHSNGSAQAQKMEEESGIQTTTTASHLIECDRKMRAGEAPAAGEKVRVLSLMDEASMSGCAQFGKVIHATEAMGERTVFLGDRLQHGSVEAGRAFDQAQAAAPMAELGEKSIRRQGQGHADATDEQRVLQRAVSDIVNGRNPEAAAVLDAAGMIHEFREARDALPESASVAKREAARDADAAALMQACAGEFAVLPAGERSNVVVIVATNADRTELTAAIRDRLKADGTLTGEVVTLQTLRPGDMTDAERKQARFFQLGQIVETARRTKLAQASEQFEVVARDGAKNILTLRAIGDGREVALNPKQIAVRDFTRAAADFQAGDRVKFVQNHATDGQRVLNGQTATVDRADSSGLRLRLADGQQIAVPASRAAKLAHAYVETSQSSQGQSKKESWFLHTGRGSFGWKSWYVNVTRAVQRCRIFTIDKSGMAKQAGRSQDKSTAKDLLDQRQVQADAKAKRAERAAQREQAKAMAQAGRAERRAKLDAMLAAPPAISVKQRQEAEQQPRHAETPAQRQRRFAAMPNDAWFTLLREAQAKLQPVTAAQVAADPLVIKEQARADSWKAQAEAATAAWNALKQERATLVAEHQEKSWIQRKAGEAKHAAALAVIDERIAAARKEIDKATDAHALTRGNLAEMRGIAERNLKEAAFAPTRAALEADRAEGHTLLQAEKKEREAREDAERIARGEKPIQRAVARERGGHER